MVLFPDTWEKIFSIISKINLLNYKPNILKTTSMKEAVRFSFENSKKWEICLMSNAAPSYSLWKSYIEKWEEFKKEIEKY